MKPSADIVIVNWNSGSRLRECLASLVSAGQGNPTLGRVVVVDNASTDGTIDGLCGAGLPLVILRNAENRGFAAACNQGAAEGRSPYILFLNPDIRLDEGAVAGAVAWMDDPAHGDAGVLGIQLRDGLGRVSRSCARFPRPAHFFAVMTGLSRLSPRLFPGHVMDDWDHGGSRYVDHVIGAFYLVRRRLFEALGGFDERFFMYLEDLDFSLRARRAGWRTYYLAEARAFHEGGGSSRTIRGRRLFYALRSRILYGYKHFSQPAAAGLLLATLVLEPLARLARCAAGGSGADAADVLEGYGALWRALPGMLGPMRRGERP